MNTLSQDTTIYKLAGIPASKQAATKPADRGQIKVNKWLQGTFNEFLLGVNEIFHFPTYLFFFFLSNGMNFKLGSTTDIYLGTD